jgi:6-phosphofructokinase 2
VIVEKRYPPAEEFIMLVTYDSQESNEVAYRSIITVTINPAVDAGTEMFQVTPDRKLRCDAPWYEPGGGGINVSRALRRLGGESTALYTAGGPIGRLLTTLLEDDGIESHAVATKHQTRINFAVRETSSDRQFRFGMPGPELLEREWSRFLECIDGHIPANGVVVASGSLPPGVPVNFYARIAKMLKDSGTHFILDTSGASLIRAADEGVYLLKPNAREFQELVQREIESEQEQEHQAMALIQRGACEVLVLSLGGAGVLLATRDGTRRMRAPSVRIRSRVGAGDSMVAGLVMGLSQNRALEESVRLGIAAGAAAVMTPGSELCRGGDAFRLFEGLQV